MAILKFIKNKHNDLIYLCINLIFQTSLFLKPNVAETGNWSHWEYKQKEWKVAGRHRQHSCVCLKENSLKDLLVLRKLKKAIEVYPAENIVPSSSPEAPWRKILASTAGPNWFRSFWSSSAAGNGSKTKMHAHKHK